MGKIINLVLGIVLIAAGLIPLIQSFKVSLPLPENAMVYQIATIVIGLLIILFSFRRKYVKVKR